MRRRSATPCKNEHGVRQQLVLFQVYHNFVLPHASLRQALAEPVVTNRWGAARVWSLREVLLFRVPPWPQMQTV
jgi:hypothetical protein